ncbi:LysE family translocator [Maridesulfovibrio sp.]|uniref:LysE family translocator n=1 Tax=Maridesulfovibrio sp. TaxID=2795000 RepID=UPI002A186D27|nr:LysE family translocator [Maridesulfovibrio sp.]
MDLQMWLLFFSAYLVITLSPGPNVLLVLRNSVKHGWKSAFITVLGNLCCQFIIVCLVAVGVGKLIQELPFWFFAMKLVGGAYLIYLGIKNLIAARKAGLQHVEKTAPADTNVSNMFAEAFWVSASNPKTLIFLSAFLPQFLDVNHPAYEQFAVMFLSICFIVTSVHLGYSYLIAYFGKFFSFDNFKRKIDGITGGLFVALGGGLLLSNRS